MTWTWYLCKLIIELRKERDCGVFIANVEQISLVSLFPLLILNMQMPAGNVLIMVILNGITAQKNQTFYEEFM